MSFVSRGFRGRRREDADPREFRRASTSRATSRCSPPARRRTRRSSEWDFSIVGEVDEPRRWTWDEFRALPSEEITVDIHCVTKWSKLDTVWQGVSVDTLLDGVETSAEYVVQFATAATRRTCRSRTSRAARRGSRSATTASRSSRSTAGPRGCSSRTSTSGRARSGCAGCGCQPTDEPGLLGDQRLPQLRRPMAGAALLGRLTWQLAEVVDVVAETPRVKTIVVRRSRAGPDIAPASTSTSA